MSETELFEVATEILSMFWRYASIVMAVACISIPAQFGRLARQGVKASTRKSLVIVGLVAGWWVLTGYVIYVAWFQGG